MKWNQIQSIVVCLSFIVCLGFLGYGSDATVNNNYTNQNRVVEVYNTGIIANGNYKVATEEAERMRREEEQAGSQVDGAAGQIPAEPTTAVADSMDQVMDTSGEPIVDNDDGQAVEEPEELKPKIAITFDDGPHPVYTELLLDGLKERNIKATFFLIGKNIEGNEEIVKRMAEEGHLIGNHTYDHVQISSISNTAANDQLEKTNELIASIVGEGTQYIRPPFGAGNSKLKSSIPMITVMWTIDPLDWTTKNVDEVVSKVVTKAKENDIILLHDCYPTSVEAALKIIDKLQAQGFEFVTVDELILD